MYNHTFLLIYRSFKRFKSTFLINLIGLSTGLACALIIYLWVNDELSFDKFHEKDSRLFQVMELSEENGSTIVHESTQGPLAEAMVKELPEVELAVPVFKSIDLQLRSSEKIVKANGMFAGKDLFKAFSFKLIHGNAKTVYADKSNIVISESLAISLFGSAKNAVGKRIDWEFINKAQSIVSGVFRNPPTNNSLRFDFAFSSDMLFEILPHFKSWQNEPVSTYILVKEGTDKAKFNQKIARFLDQYQPQKQSIFGLFVRPYSSSYLYGKYENGLQSGGRIEYVKMFSVIAILILLIACINFMNLATARASRRLKEVGIKKTIGATRCILVIQFLGEAIFMAFLSLIIAGILVIAVLPFFSSLMGKDLTIELTPSMLALLLGTNLVTGLLAGSYPALYLSEFNPTAVLKGKLKNSVTELLARKGLVIFQFTTSLVLIVSVLVIYKQLDYVQSKHLGYDKSNVIEFGKDGNIGKSQDAFLTELKNIPGVVNASSTQSSIVQTEMSATTYGISWPGKTDTDLINFGTFTVNDEMLETLNIQLKEGRSFSKSFGSDNTKLIFNEAAIQVMGLKNPLGTSVRMWGEHMEIVGVTKDFHISSLHESIVPMVFRYNPEQTNIILAKIAPGKEQQALQGIEALYKKYNPGYLFDYKFLDDAYQELYVSEKRISVLSQYFAGLAILISCLGLFGLAMFNAEIKAKEIGIRKILGASASNLMLLLSKDFIKLVLIAILIAFPLAGWVMSKWLQSFAYRIDMQWWMYVFAGFTSIFIAVVTVSFQAARAATANPIKSLRTE